MNVLIRLDISRSVGTGHFRRMQHLISGNHSWNVTFLIKTDDISNSLFEECEVIFVEDEFEQIEQLIYERDISIIIFDLLHYPSGHIKKAKSFGVKVVTFHEYDDMSLYADLKINCNFFDGYKSFCQEKLLLGPEYIVLDREIEKYRSSLKSDFIFVSFGGSDPSGYTRLFLEHVPKAIPDVDFKVHIGHFSMAAKSESYSNVELLHKPKNIFEYMAKAKMAITAGGNMMYELMYLSVPSLVIAHNDHQLEFARNAADYSGIECLGLGTPQTFLQIVPRIEAQLRSPVSVDKVIDNNGKSRVISAINSLVK